MYAIFETGGKQYKAQKGDVVHVEKLSEEEGKTVSFDALVVADGDDIRIGTPTVKGAKVKAKVIEHGKEKKVVVFKYKPKRKYRRKQGHRQPFTKLKITSIDLADKKDDKSEAAKKTTAAKTTAAKSTAAKKTTTAKTTAAKSTAAKKTTTAKTTTAKTTAAKSTTAKKTTTAKTTAAKSTTAKKTTTAKTTAAKSTTAKSTAAKKSTSTAAKKTTTAKKTEDKKDEK